MVEALNTAWLALSERNLEDARDEIERARAMAAHPDHTAQVERLALLADYVTQFWDAVEAGRENLPAGSELTVKSTTAVVVESSPERLVVRVAGMNQRYAPREIPGGLAVLLAEKALDLGDPVSLLVMGSIYAVDRNTDKQAEARDYWQKAELGGEMIDDLMAVLEDGYGVVPEPDAETR
jgi:hypothetical protein